MDQVHRDLSHLIEAKTGVRPQLDDTLDVMMIDSLAMAELTVEIEKAFGIKVDDDVLEVHCYGQLVEYVRRKSTRCADQSDA
jgi:acyl carrier protein